MCILKSQFIKLVTSSICVCERVRVRVYTHANRKIIHRRVKLLPDASGTIIRIRLIKHACKIKLKLDVFNSGCRINREKLSGSAFIAAHYRMRDN